jgi:thermostable 8-oxoguanine DNA glycosylase
MVDPSKFTNYNCSDKELEERFLFCIFVAGKPAFRTARQLEEFLNGTSKPLQKVFSMLDNNTLLKNLKKYGFGQYSKLERCFKELKKANLNLKTCSVDDLEKIHGIGPKTSRFFIVHTRPNQKLAILDVHVLRYLRENCNVKTPKTTPSKVAYKKIEQKFIEIAEKEKRDIAEFDLWIWNKYAIKS